MTSRINLEGVVGVAKVDIGWTAPQTPGGGGGYSHTLPIRVCATQQGRDFEAPDLEQGIHFRGVF